MSPSFRGGWGGVVGACSAPTCLPVTGPSLAPNRVRDAGMSDDGHKTERRTRSREASALAGRGPARGSGLPGSLSLRGWIINPRLTRMIAPLEWNMSPVTSARGLRSAASGELSPTPEGRTQEPVSRKLADMREETSSPPDCWSETGGVTAGNVRRAGRTEKRRCGPSLAGGARGCRPSSPNTGREDAGRGGWGTAGSHPAPRPGLRLEAEPLPGLPRLPRRTGPPLRELPRFLPPLLSAGRGPHFPRSRD